MKNFEYFNATRLVFGRGEENRIGELILPKLVENKTVLVVYGGGSVKRSGLLDRVITSLEKNNLKVVEFGGAQANPTMEHVRLGIQLAREENVALVLAVGGGSVIDTAKAIAMGVPYEGDAWDFFACGVMPKTALPVACVLTLPAAGSEQSIRVVISHQGRKLGAGCGVVRPYLSVINPELFFTLPEKQIRAGVIDMMSHIMERYFTQTEGVDFVSGQAEAALRSIMKNGLLVKENPQDYDAWSQIGLAGSFAHNGFYGLGHVEDWACHAMEHELSAWDESITHGEGLAVVTPSWMKHVWKENPARFVRFAKEVMGVDLEGDTEAIVLEGIRRLEQFFINMGAPITLQQLKAEKAPVAMLAERVTAKGPIGNFKKLYASDVLQIYQLAL
ncbi:MAG: iron-containing alcohol dehydrogenase [Burkholderiaceae bacterium]|nr:iron-containing alcohol dehydrogenase [Burkholderiaceae bacterium]